VDRLQSLSSDATVELAGLLVERCVAGEPAAWRSLHRQYHRNAMSVLHRLGVCTTQLEDCCQDVFLDVFRYLPRFRQEADFRTWLYRLCISHARVARRRARVATFLSAIMARSVTEAGTDPFEEGQASRQIAAALEQLKDSQRVVFVLFELEGISGKEIAEILECPEASVFRRLHEARKRFVEAIEARAG
jgi:RNA polymerase sigma-70 factor, ECF subfamily